MGETGLDATTSGFFFGGMVGEELEVDLSEDHEVDGDESSACAPYLARQLSCLRSRTPGVKDTPFFGSVWGAKEAEKRLPPGTSSTLEIYVLASITETQGVYPGSGRPEANSPTPACLD